MRTPQRCNPVALAIALVLASAPLLAEDVTDVDSAGAAETSHTLEEVTVIGHRENLVGTAVSASEGSVSQAEIAERPLLRTGDLIEFVPGLVATQHSGSGKANQYFLRGFNLDHGTDFATSVDGMSVNMRTHGHGQGYTDLNFLIPETIEELSYRKGTYYADVGDFSSAGSASFRIADTVPQGKLAPTAGDFGYARGVIVDSTAVGEDNLLYAAELQTYDGPWRDIHEDVGKASALLRWSADALGGRAHVTFMGYRNDWNSPDQIPQRAVDSGLISEFGSLDTSLGGRSSRYSISGGWAGPALGGELALDTYAIRSRLKLWSDFTYFLDHPDTGDQFEQVDERELYGFSASQQWDLGRSHWRVGAEGRYDDIDRVALLHTQERRVLDTVRDDAVGEGSIGVYLANEYKISEQLRSYVGVRRDEYDFDVDSSLDANSGSRRAGRTSVKGSLVYHPAQALELYASSGTGFHSNDARGTTIRVDPVTGESAGHVDPLVGSIGAELGSRLYFSDRLHATLAAWTLRLDSELLFVGDAGTTEASRPSKRDGIEAGLYWFANESWSANLETSYTKSRFRGDDPVGDRIPGAIPLVLSAGVSAKLAYGISATAQLKHFGRYPLIEDSSAESDGSTIVNLRVAKQWECFSAALEVLNALDSRDHDVDYFYASRLSGEPAAGIDDVHFHIFPPRSLRLSFSYVF